MRSELVEIPSPRSTVNWSGAGGYYGGIKVRHIHKKAAPAMRDRDRFWNGQGARSGIL